MIDSRLIDFEYFLQVKGGVIAMRFSFLSDYLCHFSLSCHVNVQIKIRFRFSEL
jgi:hypothetical protein